MFFQYIYIRQLPGTHVAVHCVAAAGWLLNISAILQTLHRHCVVTKAGMKRVLRKSTWVSTEYWLFWKYSSKYWVHIL